MSKSESLPSNPRDQERIMLKTLVDTIPDLIWFKDPQGVFLVCNKEFEKLFDAPQSQIIGKTDHDFLPKEIADFYRMNDLKAIELGSPRTNIEEITFARTSYKGWFETRKTPVFNPVGECMGVLGIARDITETLHTKEIIAERENQLSSIYETVGNVIFLLEVVEKEKYRFISVNHAFITVTGIPKEAILGKLVNEVIPEPSYSMVLQKYRQAIETRDLIRWEETTSYPTGTLTGIVTISPVFDEHGKCTHLVGSVNDITERKKAEEEIFRLNQTLEKRVLERTEELESANKDLESFAYSISHDLRTPLRHINGFSKLLRKNLTNPSPEALRCLEKIAESASLMSQMMEALLSFSRLGRKPVSKTLVNLDLMVRQIVEQLNTSLSSRQIDFKIGYLPMIQGDGPLIQIVFENLISNAVKFTSRKEHAIVEIGSTMTDDQKQVIFVKDNGAGFDMSFAGRLFSVFQRLHAPEDFEGTGIGLAIVKQIIHKHGGTIRAEAEVDKGATFYVTL